jgi:spore coat polysaccharide biosynthesis protein SpsF (cytidylyltransferase family)
MTFHIFLQARQNSTRFPNKILKKISNKTIFELIIERLKNINDSKIFLITGPKEKNNDLIKKSIDCNIEYFSGNENNVLDRFYNAIKIFDSKKIIRITGDCPIIDYELINSSQTIFNKNNYDLINNYSPRTFPHGYDFEIFNSDIVKITWEKIANTFSDKTLFQSSLISPMKFILNSSLFSIHNISNKHDLSFFRLTLDYYEDFQLINKIFDKLYLKNPNFLSSDVISLLKSQSDLLKINQKFVKFNPLELKKFIQTNSSHS